MTTPTITYRTGNDLDLDAVIELYVATTFGQRRPMDDRQCMARMIEEANLVVTAWEGDVLVGISRSLTDFCYICYPSDLAVRESHQQEGVGVELIRRTQAAFGAKAALGSNARIILLAAPAADAYYPHIGFTLRSSAGLDDRRAGYVGGRRAKSNIDLTLARRCDIVGATRPPQRDRRRSYEGLRGSPEWQHPPVMLAKWSQLPVNWKPTGGLQRG